MSEPELLTVMEAAAVLRIGRELAYRMVRTGEIPSIRLGKQYRVPRAALMKYLERVAMEQTAGVARGA
jgi:excisionase family DNA binding protein